MLNDYQHQVVRDLAWALVSPPLIVPADADCCWYPAPWYRELFTQSRDWLAELDKHPDTLLQRVAQQNDRRMGRYFETLWAYWLEHHPRFELLQQNIALRLDGHTLGELDMLVYDTYSHLTLHWELAVKFYLGVGDTRRQRNWHGPGKKDRLDLKVRHLRQRQSVMSRLPEVQALLADMGLKVDACGVILKGRLFYPEAAKCQTLHPVDAGQEHESGRWLTLREFERRYDDAARFYPLLGEGWLASRRTADDVEFINKNSLLESISAGHYRLPLYLSWARRGAEPERLFLVPNDWSAGL